MKLIKKYIIIVICIVVCLVAFSGCSNNSAENIVKQEGADDNYSYEIKKIRNMEIDGMEKNIGEVLDEMLTDYQWIESKKYTSPTAKGCVEVKGKDKKTGKNVAIIWGISMTDSENNNHFEKMIMGPEIFLSYNDFISYVSSYTN